MNEIKKADVISAAQGAKNQFPGKNPVAKILVSFEVPIDDDFSKFIYGLRSGKIRECNIGVHPENPPIVDGVFDYVNDPSIGEYTGKTYPRDSDGNPLTS